MSFETVKMQSAIDRLPLTAYCWTPLQGDVTGLVIIAHGLGEHALRYTDFAKALNSEGFAVLALDHRGHGASLGPNGVGDFGEGGWHALVEDIAQLTRVGQNKFNDLPTVLFAHSLGSFAAQQYLFSHANLINAVILSGSAAVDQLFAATMAARAAANSQKHDGEQGGGAFSFYNRGFEYRTGFEWLSRDAAQVDKYVADPLCGFELQPESLLSFATCAATLADANNIAKIPKQLPILLLAGAHDPVTGRLEYLRELQHRYQAEGIKHIETLFYPEGRHEMLNDINREQVYADLTAWLKKVLAHPDITA